VTTGPGFDAIYAALARQRYGYGMSRDSLTHKSASALLSAMGVTTAEDAIKALELTLERERNRNEVSAEAVMALRATLGFDYNDMPSPSDRLKALALAIHSDQRRLLLAESKALTWLAGELARTSGRNPERSSSSTHVDLQALPLPAEDLLPFERGTVALLSPTMAVITQVPTRICVSDEFFQGQLTITGINVLVIDVSIDYAPDASRSALAIERDERGRFSLMHTMGSFNYFPIVRWDEDAKLRELSVRFASRDESRVAALFTHRTTSSSDTVYLSPTPQRAVNRIPKFSLAKRDKCRIDWVLMEE
jgi:hypothetical protein